MDAGFLPRKSEMPVVKKMVCLANSRKLSGRCIAGKDRRDLSWVRPVSDRPTEEVSEVERQYEDGTDPRVLDHVEVPLKEPRPRTYQSENWLLDPEYYWVRIGRLNWGGLAGLTDNPAVLWTNGHSTYQGLNDRIPLGEADLLSNSLYLIHLESVELNVFAPGMDFGNRKRRVQARFLYRGIPYRLWVTDPEVTQEYLLRANGVYLAGECFATISLGEPHEGFSYKLFAALINPERANQS